MNNYFRKLLYYHDRNGTIYGIARWLARKGIVDKEKINGNTLLTKNFYQYFLDLSEDAYLDEFKEQLSIFYNIDKIYDLNDPKTFNEKIQYLKFHNNAELMRKLADKYSVREWIKETIGEKYLIPLVGGPWEKGEDIDFEGLPSQYVLKATHGSGMNIIVKKAEDINSKETIRRLNNWVNTVIGWHGLEHQYLKIPRRIIAEKYVEQQDGDLVDYKIHCFDGQPKIIQVIGQRDLKNHTARESFFDTKWNSTNLMYRTYEPYDVPPKRPEQLEELLDVARRLSCRFKYVRVDLYLLEDSIKFGEMTFTPASGFGKWDDENNNLTVGSWIDI